MVNFLSPEFLDQYKDIQPRNAGVLFFPVFLRTYSRFIESEKRRERWYETVTRVVEFNMSLYSGHKSRDELIQEAESLFDNIFHLEVLPAGRALWIAGTESAKKFGEATYNCATVVMDDVQSFGDIFQLLLCGCGVGFRVLIQDVIKLPSFNNNIFLYNTPYSYLGNRKNECTEYERNNNRWTIDIGDSREAWVKALRLFLEICQYRSYKDIHITINYNSIRPEGSRIKNFGGRAPGHSGLQEMFTNLAKILNKSNGKLTSVEVTDICNFIAKNVIVGGTRRSSQIALGSPNDQDFIDAKKGLWLTRQNLQRTMSNNSIVFEEDPTREQIKAIFEGIKSNGEPGFFNLKAAKLKHPKAASTNPCGETVMESCEFCNLATINLFSCIKDGVFDLLRAKRLIRIATRISLRNTNVEVSLPRWNAVQLRNRLLGVSMTGIMDTFDLLGIEDDSPEAIHIYSELQAASNDEADKYAFEMRVPRPLLVTLIKPEGTLTLLTNANSPGLHRSYAPYYIRRIRVSSVDPVCNALKEIGISHEPDQGKNERVVFSFPIKTNAKTSAANEPAQKQLNRYLTLMKHYVDHNASCTLTVGEDEWDEMEEMVFNNFSSIVGIAMLPKYTNAYPQMPYEEITREQYEEMMKTFPKDFERLPGLVDKYEGNEYNNEDELEADCLGSSCPIR